MYINKKKNLRAGNGQIIQCEYTLQSIDCSVPVYNLKFLKSKNYSQLFVH